MARRKATFAVPLLDQIRAAGLPTPEPEYRFAPPRRWRFDLAWLAYGVKASTSRLLGRRARDGRVMPQQTQQGVSLAAEAAETNARMGQLLAAPRHHGPEREAERREAAAMVEAALARLPWRWAWAVRLVRLHGLEMPQAGLMMGVTRQAVQQLVVKGVEAMRKYLEGREG